MEEQVGKRKRVDEPDQRSQSDIPAPQKRRLQYLLKIDPQTGQAKEMRPAKSIAFLFPPPVPQNQDEKRKAKQKLRISSIHPIISKPRKGYKPRRLEAKDFADVLELLVPNEHSKDGKKNVDEETSDQQAPSLLEAAKKFDQQILGQSNSQGENSQFQFSTESPGNAKRGRPSSEAQSLQLPADNITTAAKMSKADPLERPTNNTPSFTFNATPASKTETASASLPGISATQFSFGATNQASNGAENPANVPSAPVFNFNARDTVPAANAGKVSDSFKIENRATTANTEASKSSTAGTPFVFGQTPSATGYDSGAVKPEASLDVKIKQEPTGLQFQGSVPSNSGTGAATAMPFTFGATQPTPATATENKASGSGSAALQTPSFNFGNPSSSAGSFAFGATGNSLNSVQSSSPAQLGSSKIKFGGGTDNKSSFTSGSKNSFTSGPVSGFAKSTTPAFGGSGGITFGSGGTSGFGAQNSAPAFQNTAAPAFGNIPNSTSGQTSTPFTFGAPQTPSVASGSSFFNHQSTPAFGGNNGVNNTFQTSFGGTTPAFGTSTPTSGNSKSSPAFGTSMPAFGNSTVNSAFGNSAFGASSSSGFGALGSANSGSAAAFTGSTQPQTFGASTPGFGSPSAASFVGQNPSGFGNNSSSGFGNNSSGFGNSATPSFNNTSSNTFAFGTGMAAQFGSSQNASSTAFGAQSAGAFGSQQPSTPFGSAQSTFGNSMTFGATSGAQQAGPPMPPAIAFGGNTGSMTMGNTSSNQPARRKLQARRHR